MFVAFISYLFPFNSFRYQALKGLTTYFRLSTVLDAFANIIIVAIAVLAYSKYPSWILGLAATYTTTVIIRTVYILRRRREINQTQLCTIRDFFHYMNKRLFGGEPGHRFTFFRIDPIHRNYITPYARFEVGEADDSGVPRSKARYQKGMGYTGRAWENLETYTSVFFPDFPDRQAFVDYYLQELKLPEDIVRDISDHMIAVRHIFCYGLIDHQGRFLGVLSVDSREEARVNEPLLGRVIS